MRYLTLLCTLLVYGVVGQAAVPPPPFERQPILSSNDDNQILVRTSRGEIFFFEICDVPPTILAGPPEFLHEFLKTLLACRPLSNAMFSPDDTDELIEQFNINLEQAINTEISTRRTETNFGSGFIGLMHAAYSALIFAALKAIGPGQLVYKGALSMTWLGFTAVSGTIYYKSYVYWTVNKPTSLHMTFHKDNGLDPIFSQIPLFAVFTTTLQRTVNEVYLRKN